MRRIGLFALVILILLPVVSIQAQDDSYDACSVEEFVDGSLLVAEAFTEVEALIEPIDATADAEDLSVATALIDSFAIGFWDGYLEVSADGLCAEVDWLGFTTGLAFDEMVVTAQLSALALHELAAGNDEVAVTLAEMAATRGENLETSLDGLGMILEAVATGEMALGFELAECTDEELNATYDGLDEIYLAYEELVEMDEDDLSAMVIGFATLSEGYWMEFMPEVPACYQAQDEAFRAGLIIDESLIVASGYYLAGLTSDEDVAAILTENADERYAFLEYVLELYGYEEE